MKAEDVAAAAKGLPISGSRGAGSPPVARPDPVSLGADAVSVGSAAPNEAERQTAAVEAAKAAQGATVGSAVGGAAAVHAEQPARTQGKRSFFRPWGGPNPLQVLGKALRSDHPLAAFSRAALRAVPFVGTIPAALDLADVMKTLQDPKATTGQKALSGLRAAGGVVAVVTAANMIGLGAAAMTPAWVLFGAGAGTAFLADVALSRWRTGHW